MTRKHFVAVARILSEAEGIKGGEDTRVFIAHKLSVLFKGENSRFDVDRFLSASEVE
jgi:hypothetical protein